jgi:AraC-like DNA-binding protein
MRRPSGTIKARPLLVALLSFKQPDASLSDSFLNEQLEILDVQVRCSSQYIVNEGLMKSVPRDACNVYYIHAGRGVVQSERRSSIPIQRDDVLIAREATRQSFLAAKDEALALSCYEVNVRAVSGTALLDLLSEPLNEPIAGNAELRSLFARMDVQKNCAELGSRAFASALMKQCFVLIVRACVARYGEIAPIAAGVGDPRLARALKLVLDQPAAAHTVHQLASAAGMSRSAFARHFNSRIQRSPMEFVKQARLRHAATLLRTTDLPVKAVAALSGYASRSHFSRSFRAQFAIDPSKFRRD